MAEEYEMLCLDLNIWWNLNILRDALREIYLDIRGLWPFITRRNREMKGTAQGECNSPCAMMDELA